jgi:hypothetical protein
VDVVRRYVISAVWRIRPIVQGLRVRSGVGIWEVHR